ncbi:MAG: hypothetical protein Q7T82_10935 [Armatimonadota bacterium]|nr:hypothetical protein [Armatimonadota bacterium]
MLKRTFATVTAALVLALVVSIVGAAQVVRQRHAMPARGVTLRAFARALDLTPNQITDVRSVLTRLRTDAKAVIQSDRIRQEKRDELLRLRGIAKDDIYALLTSEQRAKADTTRLVDRLLSARKRHGALLRVLSRLDLTPDQKESARSILRDSAAQARAARQDSALSPEAKRARLIAIRQSALDRIKSILTADQRHKLEQWLSSHRSGRGVGARGTGEI